MAPVYEMDSKSATEFEGEHDDGVRIGIVESNTHRPITACGLA
jgi:hypothetical protein